MPDQKVFGKRQTASVAPSQDIKTTQKILIIGISVILSIAAMGWVLIGRSNRVTANSDVPVASRSITKNNCGLGDGVGNSQDNWVGVKQATRIRSSPLKDGQELVNEKATATLGRKEYHEISYGETLLEKCRFGEWSQISIVEPYWLRDIGGWVPTAALRSFETANGRRVYVASDLFWDNNLRRYDQNKILSALNAVIQRDNSCPVFDPGTLGVSSRYGDLYDPVFFVTCQTPSRQAYNVFFDIDARTFDYR